ncbi:MAG TPA: Ig domain-containing protein [Flavobacterium sp.]|jgi:hypothetical protein|uniref:Ig domain-containing protein n=1 Tax=Flavobacterium sp. TaxID=239 RepID=UPI002BE4E02D|nr:Ig domain-containing protein [Flavobacterium sp.]MCA0348947.1 Ig domain-containing protein [Bacteroidota bacterium]HPW98625.1 Ig domain-containing protein [Flavobacterium sp.]HQA75417.1 Ig domain-containing protein [Flavobacterium sp.]
MKTISRNLILLLVLVSFNSCSELLDCIVRTEPVLPNKTLEIATVGNNYNQYIIAEVKNDSNDDAYFYHFSINGDLPAGINYNISDRRISFYGVPTNPGTFRFTVLLTIDYPNDSYYEDNDGIFIDDNRICFGDKRTSKTYEIKVQ